MVSNSSAISSLASEPRPQRKLSNWIKSYVDWVGPRVRVPPQYTAWCGIYAIACALERKVRIPEKYLGGYNCDPFLFVMLIGEPGIGKGTSMNQVKRILKQLPTLNIGDNVFTKERLYQQLIEVPRSALYLILGEFADVLQKNKPDIFDTLLKLYDGEDELREGTRMRGTEIAQNPCVNFVAGTNAAWIVANITSGVIGGGLPSRISWVYADEDEAGPIKVFYDLDIEQDAFKSMEDDLVHDLTIIANMSGDMKLTRGAVINRADPDLEKYGDEDAGSWFEKWCQTNKIDIEDANMRNFFARKRTHLHKLAMIHSISVRDDMVITISDYEFAISAVTKTEKRVHKVLGRLGRNEYVGDTSSMVDYVVANGPISKADLWRRYESAAEPRQLNALIEGLVVSERIQAINRTEEVNGEYKDVTYYAIGPALLKTLGNG